MSRAQLRRSADLFDLQDRTPSTTKRVVGRQPLQRRADPTPIQLLRETPPELLSGGDRLRVGLDQNGVFDRLLGPDPASEKIQARGPIRDDPGVVHRAAQRGVAGASSPLPYADAIQASFGHHDISGVRAAVGGQATEACGEMGALAYATGSTVAFSGAPDLHTAAHEAAHVVQQRSGVSLTGGIGQTGDQYERHADAVADLVVQGRSAERVLGPGQPGPATGGVQRAPAVQLEPDCATTRECDETELESGTLVREEAEAEEPGEWHDAVGATTKKLVAQHLPQLRFGIQSWVNLRSEPTGHAQLDALADGWLNLRERLLGVQSISNDKTPGLNPLTVTWIRTQLGGEFLGYLREAYAFDHIELKEIMEDLGLEAERIEHRYKLRALFMVEVSAGVIIGGGHVRGVIEVQYANDLGMAWSHSCVLDAESFGVTMSFLPIDADIISSMGGDANVGEAVSKQYFAPGDLRALVRTEDAQAGAGGGVATGKVVFMTPHGELEFDTSGATVKFGTSVLPNASTMMGGGRVDPVSDAYGVRGLGEVEPVKTPVPAAPKGPEPGWKRVIVGKLFFGTASPRDEEAPLSADDIAALQDVAQAMIAREVAHPGEPFAVRIIGCASKRYRHPPAGATATEANNEHARQRAEAARDRLVANLLAFDEAAMVLSRFHPELETAHPDSLASVLGPVPDSDNSPEFRAAVVEVRYLTDVPYEGEASGDAPDAWPTVEDADRAL